ncbi:MAG: 50S ribosomal protein L15 [Patescibacteria group bacterium]|mgnify:CR=1 FL=1
MNPLALPKIKTKGAKRVGRGQSSGRGKTSGRGTKGQNARGKLPITHPHYEGGAGPLFKRLPIRRGKGHARISKKPLAINLKVLNVLPRNSQVDLETLVEARIVDANDAKAYGVKILGDGQLNRPLIIKLPTSKSAKVKIEKAGGRVEVNPKPNSNPKISSGSASEIFSIKGKGIK